MTPRVKEILSWYGADCPGTLTNLARLLDHGRLGGTGKLVILPVDQGFEHGPARSFAPNPPANNPLHHFRLALEAGCNAYAAPLGFIEAGARDFAGEIPLILKANDADTLRDDADPDQAPTGSVQDALRLGCCAVGLTIYPGSAHQLEMFGQLRAYAEEAKRNGLAVVVWSYPRGSGLSTEGETAIDVVGYAVQIAAQLGAHVIKVKLPTGHIEQEAAREVYQAQAIPIATAAERVRHIVDCAFAGRRIVIFSGGAKIDDDDTFLDEIRAIHAGGGFGSIIGRNAFQRPKDKALRLLDEVMDIYAGTPSEKSMTELSLHPLRFEPIFQYRLWGARQLGDWLNTPLPGDGPIGEAWVLSDRKDHASIVAEGPLKGATLTQLMARSKAAILGDLAGRFDRFPLLLKLLDVRQMLSVQVHPRDDQTDLIPKGDTGKTEAWMVLKADPDSRIYAGLKPGTTEEDLRSLTARTADELLASFAPRVGQGVLIEAGTVHSLGDGVMVFEIQENSDVTFRLYDWDHIDAKTGKPRDLQIDQALACVDFDQGAISPVAPIVEAAAPVRRERYFDTPYFRLWRLNGTAPFTVGKAGDPRILVCTDGRGHVAFSGRDYVMARGAVTLLPASIGPCRFHPDGGVTLFEIAVADLS